MRRPNRLIRPRYCGEHLGPTTARTARAEAPPEGFGRESGRTLRAKRGCEVSRAARHEGAHDPDKQPHHHQKQRPSGALHPLRDDAPDQEHYTRSEEVHCLRIGCSARAHKNKRGTGKPSHPCHNQPEHRAQGEHRAGVEQLCCVLGPHGARTYKTAPASSHGDRGRGRGWLGRRARRAYSLTPPAVRPETMYFCRYWNSRMTGTAARTAPAAKMPHGAVRSSAAHMYMPTASVN